MRPAGHSDLDWFSLFVHWMKLQLGRSVLVIEQNDAIPVQPVACSVHCDLVSKPIVEFACILRITGLPILARLNRFPPSAGIG